MLKRIAISLAGVGLAMSALAAEDTGKPDEPAAELEPIVVVAPAVIEGNQVNRFGSQLSVVTEDQIKDLNAQDLPSALRRTPGVIISRHNPIGSFGGGEGGSIFIRGQGSSRPGAEILTLVDGIPRFVGVWTHPLMDVMSIDIAREIEVYKGAQPVLLGNMAFGGVNVLTKRRTAPGYETSLEAGYGAYDTWVEALDHGGRIGNWDYYLGQSFRKSDGHRDHADGELQSYFGRLGHRLSDEWDLSLTLNYTDNYADDPGPEDNSAARDGRFYTDDLFSVVTLANDCEWGRGYLKAYWDRGDIDWVNQDGTPGTDTLTDWDNYGVRARQTLLPWDGGELMLGMDLDFITGEVDFLTAGIQTGEFDREPFRLLSPYAAFSQRIGPEDGLHAIPSIGFRYFDHGEFDGEFAPQAGLVVNYKATQVHASYARGVNYPGIFARTNSEQFLPGDNRWEDLSAELVDHYEIGVSQGLGERVQVGVTLFHDDGKDRIIVDLPPPFPPTWQNVEDFRTRGVEATISARPMQDLTVFAGVTYLDTEPEDLPYSPKWSGSVGLNYRFLERFQVSVDGLYVDRQHVDSQARREGDTNNSTVGDYFLLNAKLSYDLPGPRDRVNCRLFVAAENLTDRDYEYKAGYPMPGANLMAGMTLTF